MATPVLPSTNSIVDYLSSKGQDSSFSARRKLYNDLGFEDRLGSYSGSASQNLNLLKTLQQGDTKSNVAVGVSSAKALEDAGVPKNTSTFTPLIKEPTVGSTGSLSGALSTLVNGFMQNQTPAPTKPSEVVFRPPAAPQSTVDGKIKSPYGITPDNTPRIGISSAQALQDAGIFPNEPKSAGTVAVQPSFTVEDAKTSDTQVKNEIGISASDLYPSIFDEGDPSEVDLINRWLDSAEGRLFLERQELQGLKDEAKAEAAKAELEARYESEKTSLEEKLAANGLAFSGIRSSAVKSLADALAASELEVDRELASKLLDANLDLREAILDGVAEIAKEAKDGRKEAIQQLNAIGYAVIGNQLVPTLSALAGQRAEEAATRAEEAGIRAEKSLAISEARFAQAEERERQRAEGTAALYSGDVVGLLQQGLTPEQVVRGVADIAASQYGTLLSETERGAVLNFARQIEDSIELQVAEPENPETASGGFFSRLFGQ